MDQKRRISTAATPDKRPMRSITEYIRSPHQQAAAKLEGQKQTKHQLAAKNCFRQAEAQCVADLFRQRVEKALEEECEEWYCVNYGGDLIRKALLKVRVGETDYVHLHAVRPVRGESWVCRYAPWKSEQDPLDPEEEDYEALPERSHCGEKMDLAGCTTMETCTMM